MPDEEVVSGADDVQSSEGAGTEAPDYSEFLTGAGFNLEELPEPTDVRAALDFHSKYGGEEDLFTRSDVDKEVETRMQSWIRDPKTYQQLETFFKERLGTQVGDEATLGDDEGEGPAAKALLREITTLKQQQQAHEQTIGELLAVRQQYEANQKKEAWGQKSKSDVESVAGIVAEGNGRTDRLAKELMRRYGTGEVKGDRQSLMKEAKAIAKEWQEDKKAILKELGQAGLLRREALSPLDPKMKIEDIAKDPDKLNMLLSEVANHGFGPDD